VTTSRTGCDRAWAGGRAIKLLSARTASLEPFCVATGWADRDGSIATLYGPSGPVTRAQFEQPRIGERHQFRFVVSPEDGYQFDLDDYVRRLMARAARSRPRCAECIQSGRPATLGALAIAYSPASCRSSWSSSIAGRNGGAATIKVKVVRDGDSVETGRFAFDQGQASSFTPVHASLRFQSSSASAGSIA
jgi:hypothetical protein